VINCTGIDNQKQVNKTRYTPKTQKRNRKNCLANKTSYTLAWYTFYNLQSGNGAGRILTASEPTRGWYIEPFRHESLVWCRQTDRQTDRQNYN